MSRSNSSIKLIKTQGTDFYQNVHCGLQDKSGNLWFGTTGEGVYRYDGKTFTQVTIKDGLGSNKIWSILEDVSGNIWLGTDVGINKYDGKTISSISMTNLNYLNSGISINNQNAVWSIMKDKSGKLWFGASDGVYCYNGTTFSRFLQHDGVINKEGLHLKMVDCILEDRKGNIWFASGMPPGGEGVCLYDGKSIISFKPGGDGWIRTLLEDKNGIIWSGGRNRGVWRYDGTTFNKFADKEDIGLPLYEDKSGNIWFNGEEKNKSIESVDGIWRYDGHTFTNFNSKDGLGIYYPFCIIGDMAGNIWIGTRNMGLYRYDGKVFTNFSE